MKTIILGPPGTGKTTTLLNLVDQFIQQGIRPKQIGYFSFTKKAATEAATRAAEKFNLDVEDDLTYFRMEDFYNFCKRNHWEMDKTKTGNLIKRLENFVGEERVRIKKQQPRLVKIKTMKQTEASVSKTPYEIENF